jgi:hypothetical protein
VKVGRPLEYRGQIGRDYGLRKPQYRRMTRRFVAQIAACQSEEARRLLLGVSRKIKA